MTPSVLGKIGFSVSPKRRTVVNCFLVKLGGFQRLLHWTVYPALLFWAVPIPAESPSYLFFHTSLFTPYHSSLILILRSIFHILFFPSPQRYPAIIMATAALPPLITHKPELKLFQATTEDVQAITGAWYTAFSYLPFARKCFPDVSSVRKWWHDHNQNDIENKPATKYLVVKDLSPEEKREGGGVRSGGFLSVMRGIRLRNGFRRGQREIWIRLSGSLGMLGKDGRRLWVISNTILSEPSLNL
jgi:hypothetical protein